MKQQWTDMINTHCPLRIQRAMWQDPTLLLAGPGWSFACTSIWRLVEGDRLVLGYEDEATIKAIEDLRQSDVLRCEALVRPSSGDVRFTLSNGLILEIFVTSLIDPWVFRLPADLTLVPAPGSSDWF